MGDLSDRLFPSICLVIGVDPIVGKAHSGNHLWYSILFNTTPNQAKNWVVGDKTLDKIK